MPQTKKTSCPLCGSTEDNGYSSCFHCAKCSYMQCCDHNEFYDRKTVEEGK